ncbi:hypothetical protein [Natrinema halophilum]|uniref:Uncharacterized protein n=1 Tax=Natrinema halophilum TaxID=1699371 RepID=A0A7D5GJ71_9EURY|nr:hypothetical protein [Natrinema halophilum]QLG50354.1 hypothetical protein HYG82_16635 [Natrinema halophilum]
MTRTDVSSSESAGTDSAVNARSSRSTPTEPDMLLVGASIGTSLVVVPGVLLYLLVIRGIGSLGETGFLGLGLFAMSPGLLMGATGLWMAARG